MFNLGDLVVSKQTGLPARGEIIGILQGSNFLQYLSRTPNKRWFDLYPNWEQSPVYFVRFLDGPQKPITFDEFVEGTRHTQMVATPAEIRAKYNEIPQLHVASYPSDDLELVDGDSADNIVEGKVVGGNLETGANLKRGGNL